MVILILFLTLLIGLSLTSQKISFKSKAAWDTCRCFDPNHCYEDQCTRNVVKSPNVCYDYPDDGPLPMDGSPLCTHTPPCCTDMVARNNSQICCWIERAFCLQSQCKQLTRNHDHCGWYWSNHGIPGYGCTGLNQTPIPPTNPPTQPPASPTSTPVPTQFYPTQFPTPTRFNQPTYSPPQNPTGRPVYQPPTTIHQPTANKPTFSLPYIKFTGLTKQINMSWKKINQTISFQVQKTLDIPERLFWKIIYYDRLLESKINQLFLK